MRYAILFRYIGFGYIVNHRSGEIHRTKKLTCKCNFKYMRANFGYCTKIWAWFLVRFCGYDGCNHCNKKMSYIRQKK